MTSIILSELLAIIIGTLVSFGAGWLWYSPALFGQKWMDQQPHRKQPDDYQKGMFLGMIVSLIDTILLAILMILLITSFGPIAVLWLAAAILTGTLAANIFRGSSWAHWGIDASFMMVQIIILMVALSLF